MTCGLRIQIQMWVSKAYVFISLVTCPKDLGGRQLEKWHAEGWNVGNFESRAEGFGYHVDYNKSLRFGVKGKTCLDVSFRLTITATVESWIAGTRAVSWQRLFIWCLQIPDVKGSLNRHLQKVYAELYITVIFFSGKKIHGISTFSKYSWPKCCRTLKSQDQFVGVFTAEAHTWDGWETSIQIILTNIYQGLLWTRLCSGHLGYIREQNRHIFSPSGQFILLENVWET